MPEATIPDATTPEATGVERGATDDFSIATLAAGAPARSTAVVDGAVRCTYGELERAANRVAQGFLAMGLGPGDHVTFVGKNGLACIEVLLGAAKAGVTLTYANWRLQPVELDHVIRDSEARVILVTEDLTDSLPHPLPASVGTVLVVDGPGATYPQWRDGQRDAPPDRRAAPEDVVVQLYTSGTTGRPKGAMLTLQGFAATIPDLAEAWELDDTSVVLCVLPMFHIAGVGTVLGALHRGGTVVVDNDTSPAATVADIGRHGVTNLVLASVMLQGLVAEAMTSDAPLSSLCTVSYGASPITQEVLRAAAARLRCRLVQPYGLTETTGVLTLLDAVDHEAARAGDDPHGRLHSCGRPRPGVELRIVDPGSGAAVPPGGVGEVWARSDRIMGGYWRLPDASAEALDREGWFRTGDLGHVDDDGYLFLHDRLKDMIVSGGENIYPAEVEDVLAAHPGVSEVAVIGVPHERWGETPKAIVVPKAGQQVEEAELIAFARARMAHYRCPTSVETVAALPRNASGKVLRRVLREPYWSGRDRRIN